MGKKWAVILATGSLRNLRMDPGTKPESDWRTYKCKVKKSNIVGLQEAELWEDEFVNCGTDADEGSLSLIAKSSIQFKNQIQRDVTDLNTAFEKINKNINDESRRVDIEAISESIDAVQASGSDSCSSFAGSYSTLLKQCSTSTNQPNRVKASTDAVNQTSGDNRALHETLDLILNNQLKIIGMIQTESVYQKATAEKLYKMLKEIDVPRNTSHNTEKDNSKLVEYAKKNEFPLREVTDVLNLDKELEINREYYSYLVKTYSTIGGTSGDEEGRLIAKKLKSTLFTDHVLTLFSWTGVSRTSTLKKKEAFQKCEGILRFFQEVVSLTDSRWSTAKNEKYFKDNTLKHANQTEKNKERSKTKGNQQIPQQQNECLSAEEMPEFMDSDVHKKIEFIVGKGEIVIADSGGEEST